MAQQLLEPPVARYMQQLELALKQKVGVVPEDALTDAREFLLKDLESLRQSEPGIRDEESFEHFVATFGEPDDVAQQYEDEAKPILLKLPGVAPNWRISCTRCGRSAPASKAGITRIGARSNHKYVVGWCHDCRWLRWMRLERDLDKTNLCNELGVELTGEQLRAQKHKPGQTVLVILALVVSLLVASMTVSRLFGQEVKRPVSKVFASMPQGWSVQSHFVVPADQRKGFGRKLGGDVSYATNTVISDGKQKLQINALQGAEADDVDAIERALVRIKSDPRTVCRNGNTVFEFVYRSTDQAKLAAKARYQLGIQPKSVMYRVRFDAAPVREFDPMSWNDLFNAFLQLQSPATKAASQDRIAELSKRFEFGDTIQLRDVASGDSAIRWKFAPDQKRRDLVGDGSAARFGFDGIPRRAGVPFISVEAMLTSTTMSTRPVAEAQSLKPLVQPTKHWPTGDDGIKALSQKLTKNANGTRQKVRQILEWMGKEANLRFGGESLGTRYGTLRVLKQKHGRCWDYSDLLITLCRASGIPSRQVYGWLHQGSGHVWSEVAMDGRWHQVDATTGTICGSDYLPFATSDDGDITFVYVSPVSIEVIKSR